MLWPPILQHLLCPRHHVAARICQGVAPCSGRLHPSSWTRSGFKAAPCHHREASEAESKPQGESWQGGRVQPGASSMGSRVVAEQAGPRRRSLGSHGQGETCVCVSTSVHVHKLTMTWSLPGPSLAGQAARDAPFFASAVCDRSCCGCGFRVLIWALMPA